MIYISLTTVPQILSQWKIFQQNLRSLLCQKTNKEYYVVLSIPLTYSMDSIQEYIIPNELLEFAKDNSKLIINRDTYDYGPIVKIIGCLKYATDPNDIIIALDDDHIYHEDLLEWHLKKLDQHPNCAICWNGDSAVDVRSWIDENGVKKYVYMGTHFYIPPLCDHHLQIPGHWHSVSYKRYFLGDDFNEDVWTLSDGDDLVMGYYLKKNGIFIMCCSRDDETDFRPIVSYGRQNTVFPIVTTLTYKHSTPLGGDLIRTTYPGTNHGRAKQMLLDYIHDLSIIFTEKQINK